MLAPCRSRLLLYSIIALLSAISVGFPSTANAYGPDEPLRTEAPPKLGQSIPINPFRCDRLIRYNGKSFSCDSALTRDGENLRPILTDNPSALEMLDKYQDNRRKLKYTAYVGSLGIVMALASKWVGDLVVPDSRGTEAQERAQKWVRYGGIGITLGAIVYGLAELNSNERNLDEAIIRFNQSHPDKPIEVMYRKNF